VSGNNVDKPRVPTVVEDDPQCAVEHERDVRQQAGGGARVVLEILRPAGTDAERDLGDADAVEFGSALGDQTMNFRLDVGEACLLQQGAVGGHGGTWPPGE
jgi:hypothetical protein